MTNFEDVIKKIKKINNIKSDKDFASIINLNPDALVQRKKRNSIPHENVIEYCLKNKISIDELYENNEVVSNTTLNELNIDSSLGKIKIYGTNTYLHLNYPNVTGELESYIDTNNIGFIFNPKIISIVEDGNYLLKNNDTLLIKRVRNSFRNSYLLKDINENSNDELEVTFEDFKRTKVIGKIEAILSIK